MRHRYSQSIFLFLWVLLSFAFVGAASAQTTSPGISPNSSFPNPAFPNPYQQSPNLTPGVIVPANPNISPSLNPANPNVTPGITPTPGIVPNEVPSIQQNPYGTMENTYPNTY